MTARSRKAPHDEAATRLAAAEQRYTRARRAVVEALSHAGRPLTIPQILELAPVSSMSSTYRNLTVLCDAGVARKLSGADDSARFELSEDLSEHHHHLVCSGCGVMVDVEAQPQLEHAIASASRRAAEEHGFEISTHRIDFEGRCPNCQAISAGSG